MTVTTLNAELYQALRDAGVGEDRARAAAQLPWEGRLDRLDLRLGEIAQRVAAMEGRLTLLIAVNVGTFLAVLGLLWRGLA